MLTILDPPLCPSPHRRPVLVWGPGDTLPALQCLGGLLLAGVRSGPWGPLLVWRTEFSGTRSHSELCGGITNGEIKGMLQSHSGK